VSINRIFFTTTWVKCQIWGNRAESLMKYINKGTRVAVDGRFKLTSREYKGNTYTDLAISLVILVTQIITLMIFRTQMYRSDMHDLKKCFKCNWIKPLSDFYKHPQMADGRLNKCKDCNKKDVRLNRRNNIDYYRSYDRARGSRQDLNDLKEYRRNNPLKYKAHSAVGYAIKSGKLVKMPCEVCGENKVHAHHDDYAKPLDVRWLCPPHHFQWHKENGEGLNGHFSKIK